MRCVAWAGARMRAGRARRIAFGAASLAAAAWLVPLQTAAQAQNAAALAEKLARAEQAYAREGYARAAEALTGGLRQGGRERQVLSLRRGQAYRVLGVCDEACGDLDLRLYNQDGDLIDEDTRAVEDPMINIRPGPDGEMTVEVIMYACAAASCYYAISLFAR